MSNMDQNPYQASPTLEKSPPCNCCCQTRKADENQEPTLFLDGPCQQSCNCPRKSHGKHHEARHCGPSTRQSSTRRYVLGGIAFIMLCTMMACHCCTPRGRSSPPTHSSALDGPSDTLTAPAAVNTWTIGGYSETQCTGESLLSIDGTTTSSCFHNGRTYMSYTLYQQPEQGDWAVCRYSSNDCTGEAFRTEKLGCTSTGGQDVMSLKVIPADGKC